MQDGYGSDADRETDLLRQDHLPDANQFILTHN